MTMDSLQARRAGGRAGWRVGAKRLDESLATRGGFVSLVNQVVITDVLDRQGLAG